MTTHEVIAELLAEAERQAGLVPEDLERRGGQEVPTELRIGARALGREVERRGGDIAVAKLVGAHFLHAVDARFAAYRRRG